MKICKAGRGCLGDFLVRAKTEYALSVLSYCSRECAVHARRVMPAPCSGGDTCTGDGMIARLKIRHSRPAINNYCTPECQYAHQGAVSRRQTLDPAPRTLVTRRYRDAHPDRVKAQRRASYLRETGRITDTECSECGAAGKVELHHDDYTKPDVVRALCKPCHRVADKQRRLYELGDLSDPDVMRWHVRTKLAELKADVGQMVAHLEPARSPGGTPQTATVQP